MKYYERYAGDYARKTAHLTLAQHGAYTLLLDAYYSSEEPLPGPLDALYRICRAMTKVEREAVQSVADEFFPVGPDGLRHNNRADEQIPKAQARIETAIINGKRGGRPRKNPAGYENETQEKPSGLPSGVAKPNPGPKLSNSNSIKPKTLNPLSDSAETPPPPSDVVELGVQVGKPSRLTSEAIEVLDFLNAKTGRYFRRKDGTLAPIRARLKEGYTVAECRAVIARKCRAWAADPKMAPYLRPATLFGSEKFAQYVGEVPPPEEVSNAS